MPAATRDFLAERHSEALELALWIRAAVFAAEQDLTERVYRGWDGVGFRHPDAGYVCAIYPRDREVRLLFEHGVRLEDPEHLLEGEGGRPGSSQVTFASATSPWRERFRLRWRARFRLSGVVGAACGGGGSACAGGSRGTGPASSPEGCRTPAAERPGP